MRRGARIDVNQREIIEALAKVGATSLPIVGRPGTPDLVVGYRGVNYLIEIKNPKSRYGKKGLNPNQKRWAECFNAPVHVVSSIGEALRVIGVDESSSGSSAAQTEDSSL